MERKTQLLLEDDCLEVDSSRQNLPCHSKLRYWVDWETIRWSTNLQDLTLLQGLFKHYSSHFRAQCRYRSSEGFQDFRRGGRHVEKNRDDLARSRSRKESRKNDRRRQSQRWLGSPAELSFGSFLDASPWNHCRGTEQDNPSGLPSVAHLHAQRELPCIDPLEFGEDDPRATSRSSF